MKINYSKIKITKECHGGQLNEKDGCHYPELVFNSDNNDRMY